MSDELVKQNIEALLEERRSYEARMVEANPATVAALKERAKAVDAALKSLGYGESKTQPAKKPTRKKPAAKPTPKRGAAKNRG